MSTNETKTKQPSGSKITGLYPSLNELEAGDVEYRFVSYLSIAKRIFERISEENPDLLTDLKRRAMLRKSGKLPPS